MMGQCCYFICMSKGAFHSKTLLFSTQTSAPLVLLFTSKPLITAHFPATHHLIQVKYIQ